MMAEANSASHMYGKANQHKHCAPSSDGGILTDHAEYSVAHANRTRRSVTMCFSAFSIIFCGFG